MENRNERQVFVGEFQKNSAQVIKAHLIPWKRDLFCDVRIFEKRPDGTEHPDIRGIRLDVGLIPELIRLLEKVQEAAPHEQMKLVATGGGAKGGPDPAMPEHRGAKGSIRQRLW